MELMLMVSVKGVYLSHDTVPFLQARKGGECLWGGGGIIDA